MKRDYETMYVGNSGVDKTDLVIRKFTLLPDASKCYI